MSKKRLIGVGILLGFGLLFLVLGLCVYWSIYFDVRTQIFHLGVQGNVLAIQAFCGVFILSGSIMTILGILMAFRVRLFWWRIASVLLLVSLFLPWWQWSLQLSYMGILGGGRDVVSTHNFLLGFLSTSLFSRPQYDFNLRLTFIWRIHFIPYLTLENSSRSLVHGNGYFLISGSWSSILFVRVLCYIVFGLTFASSVLGWSGKRKRRLIGVFAGLGGVILFLDWVSLAWSAFGLSEHLYKPGANPYFMLDPYYGSFLSFGFFAALISVIVLTVSLLRKDVNKTSSIQ